jgi:chemotaxis protein CheC
MDEFTSSMMKEIGNIMCGSYITALAGFTNLFINPEPPELIVDMISAIISEISIPLALAGEENILLVETIIEIEGLEEALQGYLLLVPSVDSLEKLLKALGM